MLKKTTLFLLFLLIIPAIVSCQRNQSSSGIASKKEISAHAVSKKDEKLIMAQAYDDIKIITSVTTDTESLKKALTDQALTTMSDQIKNDLAAGKIKIRKYGSPKLTFTNYTKGIAGLRLDLVDKSYYIDKNTKAVITPAANKKEVRLLALKKVKGRWKIFAFYGATLKDKKSK